MRTGTVKASELGGNLLAEAHLPATLTNWTAKRAGGRITILHEAGKVTHVDLIAPDENGAIIATDKDGRKYRLVA